MMPQEVVDILTSNIDTLWVIDCAILVFIMQAGFMCMETGLSRHKNSINVALKNAADFGVSVVIFWIFGFGLMFGTSYNGFFGTDLFFFKTDKAEYMTYFVFQAMFVATAATIISGAVAERMKFNGYLIMTVLATGIIYPIVGHWAWSSSYLSKYDTVDQLLSVTGSVKTTGWLSDLGFVDFAGSTIVHSVGGWIALAAVLILGPRIGKYSDANKGKFTGSSFPLAVLGTLILWFGWFGFNGGSNGAMDEVVPLILINTFLAAAFGLLTGLTISYFRFKKPDPFYIILGPLAGLVAITAGCNSMTSVTSIFVGIVGAIIAIVVNEVLNKFEIDDVVGAVPVHLAAGIWGTLAVGLFSDLSILDTGLDRFSQIKIQVIGIISIGAFTFISSFIQKIDLEGEKYFQHKEFEDRINTALYQVSRIGSLVKDLKDIGRPETIAMGNIDIFDVIEGAYKVFKSKLRKNKIVYKIEANISKCNIFGSKGKLEQVFINLFQNSIDAVSELKKDKIINIKIHKPNRRNYIYIYFEDNGAPIPIEFRNRIFEPFFTTKDIGKGTGLGLSISMGILETHKCTIKLNEKGKNKFFIIKMPISEAKK